MKILPEYIETYNCIVLEQPLPNNKIIREEYYNRGSQWERLYSSDSSYHLCPYDGSFRDCKTCGLSGGNFDTAYCLSKQEFIPISVLVQRIKQCQAAGLQIKMY